MRLRMAIALGVVTLAAVALVVTPAPRSPEGVPLWLIPEGVSAHRVGRIPVFLVRQGQSITALATDVHHLDGERSLWWCPTEERFASPTHGELFDRQGRPAPPTVQRRPLDDQYGRYCVCPLRELRPDTEVDRDHDPARRFADLDAVKPFVHQPNRSTTAVLWGETSAACHRLGRGWRS